VELGQLQQYYDAIRKYGIQIYAVSVDSTEVNRALRERVGAGYTFLSDPDRTVLEQLNIRHHTPNPTGKDIAVPTQILVDKAGIVRWIYQPSNYRIRARPETILAVLDDLNTSEQ
jgi:peroxiredoxin